jgi:phosphoribosylformylglycinamidine synthase
MRNASLKFICRDVHVRQEASPAVFCDPAEAGAVRRIPIAHKDGNYFADAETLDRLEGEGLVAFRYCDEDGAATAAANPNGSQRNIAGITDSAGRVLGMMPHPERAIEPLLGGSDGRGLFERALATLH